MSSSSIASWGTTWERRSFSIRSWASAKQDTDDLIGEVATSILMKVHDDSELRAPGGARSSQNKSAALRRRFMNACSAAAS